jgi:lambda family phage portal protein
VADGGPLKAHYEAGRASDYNPAPPVAGSADSEIYSAGQRLRDWARYLSKNSSIIKAVLDARCTKGVGTGLRYEPMVVDRHGNLLPKLNKAIRDHLDRWAEAADVTGELARAEVERLAWRDWDTAGEMFARKVYRGRTRDRLGYQVQLVRSELVPYGWIRNSGAVMGIDRDEWGAPTRYWVYPYSPSAHTWRYSVPMLQPVAVPADQMVHLRRQEELDATRGVTLFHAVIFRASDIAEYQQSHRRAARASANLFASINRDPDFQAGETSTASQDVNLLDLQILDYLKAGESVNFHAPSHPNQNAVEFVNQELRQFASACRVAFSWIAYVFDRAYAAQRTELIHAWEMIHEDRAQFIRDFANPVLYREPLRIALLEGRLPARELRKADPRTLYDVRIEGPAMPTIDPVKDRQSAAMDQEMRWDSRQAIIRRFGHDPVQVDAEIEQDPFKPPAPKVQPPVNEIADEDEPETDEDDDADESEAVDE